MAANSASIANASTLVGFDADAVLEAIQVVAGEALGVCVEYDTRSFNILYLDRRLETKFENLNELCEVGEELLGTLFIDFTERKLLADFHPVLGDVRALVTYMSGLTMIRVFEDDEGLFVTIEPNAPVTPVIEAIEAVLEAAAED